MTTDVLAQLDAEAADLERRRAALLAEQAAPAERQRQIAESEAQRQAREQREAEKEAAQLEWGKFAAEFQAQADAHRQECAAFHAALTERVHAALRAGADQQSYVGALETWLADVAAESRRYRLAFDDETQFQQALLALFNQATAGFKFALDVAPSLLNLLRLRPVGWLENTFVGGVDRRQRALRAGLSRPLA